VILIDLSGHRLSAIQAGFYPRAWACTGNEDHCPPPPSPSCIACSKGFLDSFLIFSYVRAMPFGRLILQAVTHLAQMEMTIRIELVPCSVLGMLSDGMQTNLAWDMLRTLAELVS
jgi:hypothetical protein